jgi:ABC-2 type transport system permease protein
MSELYILWWRHIKRYTRARSRIIGAVGQPIFFMIALGYGLGSVYNKAGQGNYFDFIVAGVILQTMLFSGVFWGMQILFDKRFGFLKEMMVAPISRLRLLIGNALGGTTIVFFQALLVLIIAICFGFRPHDWAMIPAALAIILALSMSLTSFGAGLASMVDDFNGFQAINNFLVFPLFFLSSALYPLTNAPPLLKFLGSINPLSYGVDALRYTLTGVHHFNLVTDAAVIIGFLFACVYFAVNRFERLQV